MRRGVGRTYAVCGAVCHAHSHTRCCARAHEQVHTHTHGQEENGSTRANTCTRARALQVRSSAVLRSGVLRMLGRRTRTDQHENRGCRCDGAEARRETGDEGRRTHFFSGLLTFSAGVT